MLLFSFMLILVSTPVVRSLNFPNVIGYNIFDLYGSNQLNFLNLTSLWNITNPQSQTASRSKLCINMNMLGGQQLLGSSTIMERTYTSLITHQYISFVLRAVSIGQWASTDSIAIYIDDQLVQTLQPGAVFTSTTGFYTCGGPYDFPYFAFSGVKGHTSSSLKIRYQISNTIPNIASYGLYDFRILLRTPPPYKLDIYCFNTPTTASAPCNNNNGEYIDKGTSSPGTCHISCSSCFGPGSSGCFGCNDQYFFDGTNCMQCDSSCMFCTGANVNQCTMCNNGFYLQTDNNTCTATCDTPYIAQGDAAGAGALKICTKPCNSSQQIQYDSMGQIICQPKTATVTATSTSTSTPAQTSNETSTTTCSYTPSMIVITAKTLSTVAIIMAKLILLTSSGASSILIWGGLADMLKYIRYIDINYSIELQQLFSTKSLTEMVSDALPSINELVTSRLPETPLPAVFAEYLDYSSFLANSWEWMTALSLVILFIPISLLLTRVKKPHLVHDIGMRLLGMLKWNLCISTFVSYYGNIVFFGSLEFLTAPYNSYSGASIASLVICVVFNIAAVIFFVKIIRVIYTIRKFQRQHNQQHQQAVESTPNTLQHHSYSKDYKIVVEAYKTRSWMQQSYFVLYILRLYLFNLIIVYLYQHSVLQIALICALNVLMLVYILATLPIKSRFELAQSIIEELGLLVVNVSVAILAYTNNKDGYSRASDVASGIILWTNVFFFVLGIVYMLIVIVQQILRALKWIRDRRLRTRVAVTPQEAEMKAASNRMNVSDLSLADSTNAKLILPGLERSFIKDSSSIKDFDASLIVRHADNLHEKRKTKEVDVAPSMLVNSYKRKTQAQTVRTSNNFDLSKNKDDVKAVGSRKVKDLNNSTEVKVKRRGEQKREKEYDPDVKRDPLQRFDRHKKMESIFREKEREKLISGNIIPGKADAHIKQDYIDSAHANYNGKPRHISNIIEDVMNDNKEGFINHYCYINAQIAKRVAYHNKKDKEALDAIDEIKAKYE